MPTQEFKDQNSYGSPAGIIRTRKIIYAQKIMEKQFMILCSKIRLEEEKKERADNQREQRRAKRK